jgi:hypothetical protein
LTKKSIVEYVRRWNQTWITLSGILLVVILGLTDFVTGYEISFSIFYLAPVAFVSWFAGKRAGLTIALLSAVVWLAADVASGHPFPHFLVAFWNALVRLGFFVLTVILLNKLHFIIDEQGTLIKDLQEAMDEARTLTGLIPICAWCKRVRDDEGYWKQVELYISEHSEASFTHAICPECKQKWEEEARKAMGWRGASAD